MLNQIIWKSHITQPSLWICHVKATFIYTPRITVFWFAFDSSFI